MLTQKDVKHHFDYDQEAGKLYWRNTTGGRVQVGDEAGYLGKGGYYYVGLGNKIFSLHRVIWLYHYGYMPEGLVDHKDRDILNNRIGNLREASKTCNAINSKTRADNTSKVRGVMMDKRNGRWYSEIKSGRKYFLGYHNSKLEAACARLAAEQCLGWDTCTSSSAYEYVRCNINSKTQPLG